MNMRVRGRPRKGRGKGTSPTTRKRFQLTGELAEVTREIVKRYPIGVVRRASDRSADYGRLRTGIITLDISLGGGFKLSRGSMLYGEKAAGKSTIATIVCRRMQDLYPDKVPVWIDIEGTFDYKWAEKLGVDLDRMIILEPESGEHAVDLADGVMRAKETSIVVTDSIAFLTPMKEIEESAEKSLPGIHARLIGNYIRKMNNALISERHRRHVPMVLHLNQFRMKIGVMFGDPRVLPGGKALEFSTSQQVLMRNKEHKDSDNIIIHNEYDFTITKDKTGGRMKEGKFKLIRDSDTRPEGYIEQTRAILKFGAQAGVITGKYDLGKHGRHPTIDAVSDFLFENQDASFAIQGKIIKYFRKKWDIS